MRIDRIVSLLIALASIGWSQTVYWKWIYRNKKNRIKHASLDGWTIHAEIKKQNPGLASTWITVQVIGALALIYFF